METEHAKKKGMEYGTLFAAAILGAAAGLITGILDTVFGKGLLLLTDFRQEHLRRCILFLPMAGMLIVWAFRTYGGKAEKGMGLVFEAGHGKEKEIPLRLIPFAVFGTWLTHLCGGSAGREGVAVQIGAAVSHYIGRKAKREDERKVFLVAGMAAGFSGLFQTPLAAVCFALEVLAAGKIRYEALLPALTASFTACEVSKRLGLEKFTVSLGAGFKTGYADIWKFLVLGLVFGVAGGIFSKALREGKKFAASCFENPVKRAAVWGTAAAVLIFFLGQGRYAGLGTNLIAAAFGSGNIYGWDWLLKLGLTVLTLSAGFQGGEVTPLFSIGASLGFVLSGFFGLPGAFAAALGYAGVFGGATNTFFAPVLIGAEVFGYEYLPYFFVVCASSYLFNGGRSIYTLQKLLD